MTTTTAAIAVELCEAALKLGATSDLLDIVKSSGDGQDTRDMLIAWNDRHNAQGRRAENDQSVSAAIRRELYMTFEYLGAPVTLLGELGSWGEGNSDAQILAALKQFNRWGRTFDTVDLEIDDLSDTLLGEQETEKPS